MVYYTNVNEAGHATVQNVQYYKDFEYCQYSMDSVYNFFVCTLSENYAVLQSYLLIIRFTHEHVINKRALLS